MARTSNKTQALAVAARIGATYSTINRDMIAPEGAVFASTGTHAIRLLDHPEMTEAGVWAVMREDLEQGVTECEDFDPANPSACEGCLPNDSEWRA